MLTALTVRDVVLIESAALELGPGLTALTGETGAGKSILLDALGLALGARADSGLVRSGSTQAQVSAEFDLPEDHAARAVLADQGLDSTGPVRVRRQLKADGGGRAWVQDESVGIGVLRALGIALVEVHGQHDERGLLAPAGHRALLDGFGGLDSLAAEVLQAHAAWRAAAAAEAAAASAAAAAETEREELKHAAAELALLKPQPGEEADLATARAAMQKGARLAGDLAAVDALLGGSDGALSALRQAARRLERMAGEHETLAAALESLDRAVIESAEAEDKLAAAADALAFDPARLEAAEARLFDLRAAARKHRVAVDALPELALTLSARLEALDGGGAHAARLAHETAAARAAYDAAAGRLSAARAATGERLAAAVMAELAPLKLDAARFRVALAPLAEPGASGLEAVAFEVSTNPGAPFGPLQRIASGGELSRFALALKVALAGTRSAATLIFDEIDRGVGGGTAAAIGARLARLGLEAQVLVVTHSPQVAAAAVRQLRISKAGGRTEIEPLSPENRIAEIARMLSGAEVTPEARAQAERLLGQR
ncbi:MAG: DNA repair protein RecN [Sphingomonadaceae bacterium]|nr:DNA repair protein RecN [Sphingomonadaceae bacterium]